MLTEILAGKTLPALAHYSDPLSARDRAFVHLMVMSALRHYGELSIQLNYYIKKMPPWRPHFARGLLLIGAAQILILKTPPHAAIDETLNACYHKEQPYRGLINAVLRKLAQSKAISHDDFINTPKWFKHMLTNAYGEAHARKIAQAHQHRPPLDLQFTSKAACEDWQSRNSDFIRLNDTSIRLINPPPVADIANFSKGEWWVQDIAASLAVKTAPDSADALDICAAPGGKTLQLAARGAKVTALDISQARLKRLRENIARCQFKIDIVQANFLNWHSPLKWQSVVLDAPCSTTGTLRRHPDVIYHRNQKQRAELIDLQKTMLAKAAPYVQYNGVLTYCTCSLDPAEGEIQIETFLAAHKDFALIPIAPEIMPAGLEQAARKGYIRTTPAMLADYGFCDGFFIAHLRKISS